ncbi:hypothetical protein [Psychroserpens luteus]|uniref:DUF304 domain-containing protein n=1 Tax=Psychroserpens luteus TaxID=1434066 RepID=A0ABW5ZRK7_9FLAO|nr:hypothetical protein [Psychroserpens luteus]
MKIRKVQIKEKANVKKALNKNSYIIVLFSLLLFVVDIDLFSPEPRFFSSNIFMWKGLAIVFQIIYIISLIQWYYKKKRIANILSNGIITKGTLISTEKIKSNSDGISFYIHLYEYEVDNKKYEVSFKNKSSSVNSYDIIYESNDPQNAVPYADLKDNIKRTIEESILKK